MPNDSIHYATIEAIGELIKTKQVSPVEITRLMLARIDQLDNRLHSYITVLYDQAMATASKSEHEIMSGTYRGPLHGIPIAVKDLCYTKGVRTTGGLKVLAEFEPEFNATVIEKLDQAGSVLLGKLNLTEGAVGGYNRHFKIPINPWNEELWTGSSSSGSGVATAAGLCYGSLGSDTGGSIRFPAMACGITGLKPTYGRVSRHGILPLAESLDHVGPMTRTVKDAAIIFDAIAGYDHHDTTSLEVPVSKVIGQLEQGIAGYKIGYDPAYSSTDTDSHLIESIENALRVLEELGASVIETKIPDISELRDHWRTICRYEAAKAHQPYFPSLKHEYGTFFGEFLEMGLRISQDEYNQANRARDDFNEKFFGLLDSFDAFACPGGGVPFKIPPGLLYGSVEEIRSFANPSTYFQFTIPANFAGVPSLSFPCGRGAEGFLYTMQLVGSKLSEATLCRIGHAYQQVTTWHQLHPLI